MIKQMTAAAVIATASLSFVAFAQAEDFPAAPMNSGPMMMTGMGPVGAAFNAGMMPVNMVVQPIVSMGQPAMAPAPMAAPMMMKKHHRHHMMKHMMMKKSM